MAQKYPSELHYTMSAQRRLTDLKELNSQYVFVRSGKVLLYTSAHVFAMIGILLLAIGQTSPVSFLYILVVGYCLLSS
jgi:hypothetical protein